MPELTQISVQPAWPADCIAAHAGMNACNSKAVSRNLAISVLRGRWKNIVADLTMSVFAQKNVQRAERFLINSKNRHRYYRSIYRAEWRNLAKKPV
jgi:hypothetical protein